jgi:hypothetical protein
MLDDIYYIIFFSFGHNNNFEESESRCTDGIVLNEIPW